MDEETLRKTAYRIWEERGRPHGEDFEHWLQARQEYDDNANDGLPGSIASSVTPPGLSGALDRALSDAPAPAAKPTKSKRK
jgi:hypothetical protein